MKDLVTGIVLLTLGGVGLLWAVPNGISGYEDSPSIALSASFWPYAILVLFTGLGLVLLAQGGIAIKESTKEKNHIPYAIPWHMIAAILLLIPYYYLAETLGFLLTSMLAFGAYALLAGEKNYKSLVLLAVLVPLVITVFFIYVAQVLVPLGPLSGLLS